MRVATSGTPGSSRTSSACAMVETRSEGSRSGASGIQVIPSGKCSAASAAAWIASRVFPVPPGPVRVSSRTSSAERRETTSCKLTLASEEESRGNRQVCAVERLERRKVALAELVDALGSRQVFEAVLAEVTQLVLDEGGTGGGHEHLSAVAGCGDAGGAVDVSADVALLGEERRARVQANAHLNRARGEPLNERLRRAQCRGSTREGEEEGVSLRVDLDAPLGRARIANHAPVLGERLRVGLGAELMQQRASSPRRR